MIATERAHGAGADDWVEASSHDRPTPAKDPVLSVGDAEEGSEKDELRESCESHCMRFAEAA